MHGPAHTRASIFTTLALVAACSTASALLADEHATSGGSGLATALVISDSARTPVGFAPPTTPPTLTITRIEFTGLSRTPLERARRATGLATPAAASPARIQDAIRSVRDSRLFESVEAHTRPDTAGTGIVLVLDVRESRPALRFGLGYEDFSSWYLIPAQLAFDNLDGRGLALSLSARIGYRVNGLELALRRPAPRDARDFWEARLHGDAIDRVYYLDSTETQQRIRRGGLDLRVGHSLSRSLAIESWAAFEKVEVDSNASVLSDRLVQDRQRGDQVPFVDLPVEIQRDVRDRRQSRFGLALVFDRRAGQGLEAHGLWARASGEGAFSSSGDFASWQADARAYAPIGAGLQLAARLRGASLSHQAPFYERYYAGGLYTVRGYPSQSLSPPQGDLNLGSGSIELRSMWLGSAAAPRVAAVAFLDGGATWSRETPKLSDFAYGLGFGFRVRVPWLGLLGVDAARPLSGSPVDEAFHLNGSLGWAF